MNTGCEAHSLHDIVAQASSILGDQEDGHEYTSFSQEVLTQFACTILPLIAEIHPDAFTNSVKVALGEGEIHDLSGECGDIVSVSHLEDKNGNVIPATKVKQFEQLKQLSMFPDPTRGCCDSAAVQYSFAIDPDSSTRITISPPIAPDANLTAAVLCKDLSGITSNPDVPLPPAARRFSAAIREWVLYSATSTDDEAIEGASSGIHFANFVRLIPGANDIIRVRDVMNKAKRCAGE